MISSTTVVIRAQTPIRVRQRGHEWRMYPARIRKERLQITRIDPSPVSAHEPPSGALRSFGRLSRVTGAAFETVRDYLDLPRVGGPGRNIGLDALRGLAILLVVLGHSISNAVNLYQATTYNLQYYVSNFIYTFHMPLFFLVSGYVLFGKRIRIGDRAIRLLLPFFAWIPIYWMVNRYIHHYPWPVKFLATFKDTVLQPGAGLWFLPTLFLCALLLIPARHIEKKLRWGGELYLVIAFIAVNLMPFDRLGIMQVKYFFAFFAAGYLLAKYRSRIDLIPKKTANIALLAVSAAFLLLFTLLYFYGRIQPYTFPFSIYDLFKTPGAYVIRYFMAGLGIITSIVFIKSLKTSHVRSAFAWLGLVTMEIYVAHGLTLQVTFGHGWLEVFVSVFTGVFLSLAIAFLLLRRWWVSAEIFYGIKPVVKEKSAEASG
jgi:fucose 4-O-acetylase-like acetyltransferase